MRPVRPKGFTLIEVLFVLALFGLISSLAVSNFTQIQEGFFGYKQDGEWLLKNSLQRARWLAAQRHENLFLSYSKEEGFQITDSYNEPIETVKMSKSFDKEHTSFNFYQGEYNNDGQARLTHTERNKLAISQYGFLENAYVKLIQHDTQQFFEINAFTGELLLTES